MSIFDLWLKLGLNIFLEKVAIVIAGFLGVFLVRIIIRLFLEMIKRIMKNIKKSNA